MQLHKRFTTDQVKAILQNYEKGLLSVQEALHLLEIGRSVFFDLAQRYRNNPQTFSIAYQRKSPRRIRSTTEKQIRRELQQESKLIQNPQIPITSYNYSAIRDNLKRKGIQTSLSTILRRAKETGYYPPRKEKQSHDRQVLTTAIGALIQHDASHHLWSPYAEEKWALITSLDDYSRYLLYAHLIEAESTWAHIEAARELIISQGIPQYYVDSLRVFRWVAHGQSTWIKQSSLTDEVNTQWKRCVQQAGSKVIYALSPQAKGKIERPYRWLQDRIVRTCAREKIKTLEQTREVLRYEVDRYNNHQIHSTTHQIPQIRFTQASQTAQSFFRPWTLPQPYTHVDDVFCLQEKRTTDGYRKVSLWNQSLPLPKVNPYQEVTIHIIPKRQNQTIDIHIWHKDQLVLATTFPKSTFPKVHF